MKKMVFVLILSFIIVFTGCQKTTEATDNKIVTDSSKTEQQDKLLYKVSNSGGVFTKKDLIYFIMTDRFFDGDKSNNQFEDVNKGYYRKTGLYKVLRHHGNMDYPCSRKYQRRLSRILD